MKQYSYMDCRVGRPAFVLFLLAMLMLARDTLVTSCLVGFSRSQFLMLGMMAVVAAGFLFVHRHAWRQLLTDRRMVLLAVSTAVILLPMLLKQDWQMMYFSILLCLYFAVFLSYFRTVSQVAKVYVVLLAFLAAYSILATYVLKMMAWDDILNPPLFVNDSGWKFWNFGFSFAVASDIWYRNFGIFREPGVYQYFLLLGLYLTNYEITWRRLWAQWAVNLTLAATMVTTFATGGLIELALLAVFLFFDKKWYRTALGRLCAAAAVLAVGAAAALVAWKMAQGNAAHTVYYEVYDMVLRLLTDSESRSDRFGSILTNLTLFAGSPLLGAEISRVLYAVANNTSSTLILYAILGILGGTLNVAAWFALAWRRERHILANLCLILILFMSFNTQNLVADVFFWLFPMMALAERALPRLPTLGGKV